MGQVDAFSTVGLSSGRKLSFWNDRASECFLPLVCNPTDLERFQGSIARANVGELVLGEVTAEAQIVRHTRTHAARMSDPMIYVHLQLEGESLGRQDGREAALSAGDFTLMDATRPHETVISATNRMLLLGIPLQQLRRRIENPECLVALRMRGDSGVSALASQLLRAYWREYRNGLDEVSAGRTAASVIDLLAAAYACVGAAHREIAGTTHAQTAQRFRVLNHVEINLCDPELSPRKIASACGMSVRALHALFADRDETLGRYLLRRRLEGCARALTSQLAQRRPIGAVALDHGFSSLTHFCRVFRARYGMSPRDYRRTAADRL